MRDLSVMAAVSETLRTDRAARWMAADHADLSSVSLSVPDEVGAALARIAALGKPADTILPEDIRSRELHRFAVNCRERVFTDAGFIVLKELPVAGRSDVAIEAMIYALACHLGRPVCQSAQSDRVGYVRMSDDPVLRQRGYRSNKRQRPHTDLVDLVGLFCVRPAKAGGESVLVSSAAVHDAVAAERPDLLPILYRGFRHDWRGEAPPDATASFTDYEVPVFCRNGDRFAAQWNRYFFEAVPDARGAPFTDREREAIDLVSEISQRDAVQLRFRLAAGEAVLFDNTALLHCRDDFEDWPDPARRRLLLRLWIETQPSITVHPAMRRYVEDCKRAYGEFTSPQPPSPVEGR